MRYNKTQKEVQPLERKELKTSKAQRDASLKWERENNEKITVKLRIGTDPSKAQIRAAAAAAGQSVNAWIIEAIRDKL
jgi:predicted HicB family RNase H-like nuclease